MSDELGHAMRVSAEVDRRVAIKMIENLKARIEHVDKQIASLNARRYFLVKEHDRLVLIVKTANAEANLG